MKKILILMMVCLVLSPAVLAGEGEEEHGNLALSFNLDVKFGQEAQFEEGMKKQVAWYAEQNDQWSWHTWQWVTGPNYGDYVFRSPNHHWADMDARGDLAVKARAHFLEVMGAHLESVSNSVMMWHEDISSWPEDYGDVPFVSVLSFHIKYGKSREFHNVLKRIHRTVEKAGWSEPFGWMSPVSGSEMPRYTLVLPHKDWADMAEPENPFWKMMEETAGRPEADSIRESLINCVETQESALARFRPELSHRPGE